MINATGIEPLVDREVHRRQRHRIRDDDALRWLEDRSLQA